MTVVFKNPQRRLQAIAAIAQWALYVLALAWVTLGLIWGGFHFAIVPRIGELRPWLEQQASQHLGVRVQIGALEARSNGLIPSVELRQVRLFDNSGRQAVYVPKVTAGLSPRSLLGAAFEQLVVEGAELDVRRAANGQIWIGGLALTASSQANSPGLDWLFSQTELVVRHGQVRWTDETRNVPTLALRDLDLVIRNRGRTHAMRLDVSPPIGWGGRVTLMGKFLHPLFSAHHGDWTIWQGNMYGLADALDLAALHEYTDWSVGLEQGRGSVRWWADFNHGEVRNATADLGLQAVVVRLAPGRTPLALNHVGGRLTLDSTDTAQTWGADDLVFDTADGLHWPGGKLQLRLARGAAATHPDSRSTLSAEQLDLAVLADVALHLPLSEDWQAQVAALAPQGILRKLRLSWSGASSAPRKFEASGQLSGVAFDAQPLVAPVAKSRPLAGLPGLRGAAVDFSLNQSGGQAKFTIGNGAMAFPGIFAQPEIPVAKLSADVSWKLDSRHLGVDVANARFDNADLQGEARAHWQTADLPRGAPASLRFPGVLDLQGNLSRANVAALGRYLPLAMEPFSRTYLQQALLAGKASNVQFRVRGDLSRFPFADAKQGDFRISADVQNASVAYAPPGLPAGAPDHDGMVWPPLTQVQCAVLLDHDVLEIKSGRGLVVPATALAFSHTDVTLSKLYTDPQLTVNAEARGPLPEALEMVNHSPLLGLTAQALVKARVAGLADYKLRLNMPLERPEKTTVQGSVTLGNNEFQYAPEVPRLVRARGVVSFNENGFSLSGVSGRTLGGDVRLDGGLNFAAVPTPGSPSVLRMQGVLSADGLRQATELGPTAKLGRIMAGSTTYTMTLTLRGGAPELAISSNLQGMTVKLPAPLGKPADVEMPLRLELYPVHAPDSTSMRLRDVFRFELGQIASVTYLRDVSGAVPKVLRGAIGVGLTPEEVAPLPTTGVSANIHIDQLDVDAWITAFAQLTDTTSTTTRGVDDPAQAYVPNQMALRTNVLTFQGRKINRVLLGAGRESNLWRVNVDAAELNGYLEYRQPGPATTTPGRLYARLARLVIGPSAEQDVEELLDQQPVSIPALDIVVDDMELRGKKLGRVEIQAVNRRSSVVREGGGEWQLDRFNITTPEATLTASGNWALPDNVASGRRRTALQFKLDLTDAGALLARMGMPGVVAKGRGLVQGNVAWVGSPMSPDYASMSGGFNTNVETGQFLKADPGIAKLFGVLSLQSLPRRLALDFRDVFSDGFAFDFVRGDVAIADGIARTDNLQMKGVSATVRMEGQADIARETQLLKVVVVPEINAGSASLLASAVNPVVGITTFLAQILLRRPLIDATTQEFQIDGTWVDPRVTRIVRPPHN